MILEGLPGRQEPVPELEEAKLEERVLVIQPDGANPVLGAEIAEEEEEDQRVHLVTLHLEETAGRDVLAAGRDEVPEVLGAEQVVRERARHPGRLAAPLAGGGKCLDLSGQSLQPLVAQAVEAVMNDSSHGRKPTPTSCDRRLARGRLS